MIKSYKVRLEPNNKQEGRFVQFAGAARFAYNWALEQEIKNYEQGKPFIQDGELRKLFTEYKKTNTWLYSISTDVTKQAIKDACISYKKFFNGKASFPKFKSRKRSKLSFYQDTVKIGITESKVRLEKLTTQTKLNRKQFNWVKLAEKNITVITADRFYPSSKTCSNCGTIKSDLKLSDRVFVCDECGLEIDRDYNASLNLYHLGSSTVSSTGINACGVLYQTGVAKAKQGTMKQEINKRSKRLL